MIGTIAGIIAMLLAAGVVYAACVVAGRADRQRGE